MSNKTDDVENDAAFALAEMHRLRADLTAERERREEAESRRDHTAQWYAERLERLKQMAKERGFWSEMAAIIANGTATAHEPPTYAQQLNMAKHRAEQAERERDAQRVLLSNMTTECEHNAAMWREERAARERAEADNAALLVRLAPLIRETTSYWTEGDGSSLFLARDSEPGPEVLDTNGVAALVAAFDAEHPGAALLERLRALERVRELLKDGVMGGHIKLIDECRELSDACAAADALKGET